jgi:hypothetical protein
MPQSKDNLVITTDLMDCDSGSEQCSLERASALVEPFPAVGLLDLAVVSQMEVDVITKRIQTAGYQRGRHMALPAFATQRKFSLMAVLKRFTNTKLPKTRKFGSVPLLDARRRANGRTETFSCVAV